jgi:glycosyltransferase involved in cell wall biosynthesis
VTFSGDWTNVAVEGVDNLPFVWGPIGGVTKTPLRLFRYLGMRGAVAEILRAAIGGSGRILNGSRLARAAALVIAANKDVEDRYRSHSRRLVLEPHAVCNETMDERGFRERNGPVIGIGRLVPWKGWSLALETIARQADPRVKFLLLGRGPDRGRLEARARRRPLFGQSAAVG